MFVVDCFVIKTVLIIIITSEFATLYILVANSMSFWYQDNKELCAAVSMAVQCTVWQVACFSKDIDQLVLCIMISTAIPKVQFSTLSFTLPSCTVNT